ncbi:MAG: polymorphic toxin type 23 domain-containing protein, partial [Bacteroidia bacterium]|nr:polymorphic toxin type 23 domain-containing protein [Bacteroidia bacterium]
RLRNPATQVAYATGSEPALFLGRGYTGHEHLPWFGLVNMNARLYDPVLGRFLNPDPYVQMPDFTQNFNRYSYVLNNPLKYTDPTGEKMWPWLLGEVLTGGLLSFTAVTTGTAMYAAMFPMTNASYELQKYISPIAFKPTFGIGSHQNGIGFDVSVGMLKGSHGYRFNYGGTYYWSSHGGFSGWESRQGGEWELLPLINYSATKFSIPNQTTGRISIGDPFSNILYENDFMFGMDAYLPFIPKADNGDRFRTAAVQMNYGPLSVNLNMFTGDPGLDPKNRPKEQDVDGWWTYTGGSANERRYRVGALSIGFGPLRIGRNSEAIRNIFQNELIHKNLNPPSPLFKVLGIPAKWYWYFGFGSGNTLW